MTLHELVVTSVDSNQADYVIIEFEDGHKAVFEPYTYGGGNQVEGLRYFYLYRQEELVVQYAARLYQSGPREDEHYFVQVAAGYTHEMIASYWEAAKVQVNELFFKEPSEAREGTMADLLFPWRVTSQGSTDLERIKHHRVPLPDNATP